MLELDRTFLALLKEGGAKNATIVTQPFCMFEVRLPSLSLSAKIA
jgi:hypothetical protein